MCGYVLDVYICFLGVFESFNGEVDLTQFLIILIGGKILSMLNKS